MKTKANVLILLTVVVTVVLSSCNASRKAGCDAYGANNTEIKSNDVASR